VKYADAKPLLRWARRHHRTTVWAYPLADSLSVENTPDRIVPKRLRAALTDFRHQTQEARVRQAFKFLGWP
jgi:hypothetical protein